MVIAAPVVAVDLDRASRPPVGRARRRCVLVGDASDQAREASRDLPTADRRPPTADRLGFMLHEVAADAPDIDAERIADQDWVEDYLQITNVEAGRIWFEGGVGPISVPSKASDLARPGWSIYITAARSAGTWHLLEVGFVYP
jgi:hypothetical protein